MANEKLDFTEDQDQILIDSAFEVVKEIKADDIDPGDIVGGLIEVAITGFGSYDNKRPLKPWAKTVMRRALRALIAFERDSMQYPQWVRKLFARFHIHFDAFTNKHGRKPSLDEAIADEELRDQIRTARRIKTNRAVTRSITVLFEAYTIQYRYVWDEDTVSFGEDTYIVDGVEEGSWQKQGGQRVERASNRPTEDAIIRKDRGGFYRPSNLKLTTEEFFVDQLRQTSTPVAQIARQIKKSEDEVLEIFEDIDEKMFGKRVDKSKS